MQCFSENCSSRFLGPRILNSADSLFFPSFLILEKRMNFFAESLHMYRRSWNGISEERKSDVKMRSSEVGNAKNTGLSNVSEVGSPEEQSSQYVCMPRLESSLTFTCSKSCACASGLIMVDQPDRRSSARSSPDFIVAECFALVLTTHCFALCSSMMN